jgi:hypothetical protein
MSYKEHQHMTKLASRGVCVPRILTLSLALLALCPTTSFAHPQILGPLVHD